jgi:DNA (cytosine-5)-methyltransferase 1
VTRIGSLFSGYGGLDLAVMDVIPDASVAWHVEFDKAPAAILAHHWPDVPNHHDVTTVDWAAVEPVDIITGGFPCQDLSHAGKRAGLRPGTRSGLWSHMAYAVAVIRPSLVVIENVLGILSARAAGDVEPCALCLGDDAADAVRALGAVCADLAALGFDARWTTVRAADAGACHGRARVFIVAHPNNVGSDRGQFLSWGGADLRSIIGTFANASGGSLAGTGATGDGLQQSAEHSAGFIDLLPTPDASAAKYRLGGGVSNRAVWKHEPDAASSLLPTPTAQDAANNAGPSQWVRNSLPLNTLAMTFTEDTP